jgi:hypothetical protein
MSEITRVISHYKREREKRKIQKIYQEVFQQEDYFDSNIYSGDEMESCRAIAV